jgi:hypothetical protein
MKSYSFILVLAACAAALPTQADERSAAQLASGPVDRGVETYNALHSRDNTEVQTSNLVVRARENPPYVFLQERDFELEMTNID